MYRSTDADFTDCTDTRITEFNILRYTDYRCTDIRITDFSILRYTDIQIADTDLRFEEIQICGYTDYASGGGM